MNVGVGLAVAAGVTDSMSVLVLDGVDVTVGVEVAVPVGVTDGIGVNVDVEVAMPGRVALRMSRPKWPAAR